MSKYKVHVAFGFHVNCYHSYRGDTNDNFGFGSDIRIIGKTLDVLTELNESGIPVKGTWDSENFFSLQKILPEYAPDIIEKMKERVTKYGDENIIMGYNNGALSAMTEDEFCASVELAVTNENGSGLRDIFGEYEKIVRPQEVMFTPSQVSLYNKLGVKALCLYYSCIPFDAFRTVVPRLPDEFAFNPLTYTYRGESMTILPTYSNCDVMDAGCLRSWVKDLHAKQLSGEINHDVLIFINMDADAIFWETLDLGKFTGKLANTDGIHGLVTEVADLPFVVFDTPGGYLKNHEPLGEISFTHDVADGNFTGYASWAEKPFNRKIWTELERARAMARVNAKKDSESPSFADRVLLLSTTHFGLATPVLNIQREKTALDLAESVIRSEREALPKSKALTVHNITCSTLQTVQLKLTEKVSDIRCLVFEGADLESYTAFAMDGDCSSVFAILKFASVKKKYRVNVSVKPAENTDAKLSPVVSSGRLSLGFAPDGRIISVICDGRKIGGTDFLSSYLTFAGKRAEFERRSVSALPLAGNGGGLRVSGEIHLPGEESTGSFTFDFLSTDFSDGVFVRTQVNYPYTPELSAISTENSSLGRYTDPNWLEAAPFELTPHFSGDVSVIKRNFMGDVSSFKTQTFPECDEKNRSVCSFNHQLTGGFVGLADENGGIAVANARQVLSSMAHCPMRLDSDKTVHMNPFGTYFGPQRHHWSRSKGQILDVYPLISAQGKSIAPSYNGSSETAVFGLFPLSGKEIETEQLEQINAFSDGAVVTAPEGCIAQPFLESNAVMKESKKTDVAEKDLKSPMAFGLKGNLGKYVTKGSKAIFHIVRSQLKSKN